jgi:hypothetical protein
MVLIEVMSGQEIGGGNICSFDDYAGRFYRNRKSTLEQQFAGLSGIVDGHLVIMAAEPDFVREQYQLQQAEANGERFVVSKKMQMHIHQCLNLSPSYPFYRAHLAPLREFFEDLPADLDNAVVSGEDIFNTQNDVSFRFSAMPLSTTCTPGCVRFFGTHGGLGWEQNNTSWDRINEPQLDKLQGRGTLHMLSWNDPSRKSIGRSLDQLASSIPAGAAPEYNGNRGKSNNWFTCPLHVDRSLTLLGCDGQTRSHEPLHCREADEAISHAIQGSTVGTWSGSHYCSWRYVNEGSGKLTIQPTWSVFLMLTRVGPLIAEVLTGKTDMDEWDEQPRTRADLVRLKICRSATIVRRLSN